ncbi:MAG: hypothetical protein K2X29_03625 [Candidatus Obscuribacterales bacterium]|nr:hypothetical protein [Candidatus Obscuribacterales bacterium]
MGASFTADEILYSTYGRIEAGCIDDQKGHVVWKLEDVGEGDWFLALPAAQEDAHDRLSAAFDLGARGCIVNRRSRYSFAPKDRTLLSVPDTKVALLELVRYWRYAVRPIAVGVAGSTGRRATILLLRHLLQDSFQCHIAFESSVLGWAEDVLLMPQATGVLLFEAAGVERGDVARIGGVLTPDIAVITRIQHPLPSPTRDAHIAALYCEILETVNRYERSMAVIYDGTTAVQERCGQLLSGLTATSYSQRTGNTQAFSEGLELESLNKSIEFATGQRVTAAEVWCAIETARAIGLNSGQIEAAVGKVVAVDGS